MDLSHSLLRLEWVYDLSQVRTLGLYRSHTCYLDKRLFLVLSIYLRSSTFY